MNNSDNKKGAGFADLQRDRAFLFCDPVTMKVKDVKRGVVTWMGRASWREPYQRMGLRGPVEWAADLFLAVRSLIGHEDEHIKEAWFWPSVQGLGWDVHGLPGKTMQKFLDSEDYYYRWKSILDDADFKLPALFQLMNLNKGLYTTDIDRVHRDLPEPKREFGGLPKLF